MVEFAGWELPVQYSSIVAEHVAARRNAAVFDVSHMGEVEISGAEAERCCACLLANDARRLRPGQGQYSLITNPTGGVVDDVILYRLAADRFLLCVNAANTEKDFEWLRDRAPRGAVVRNRSDDYALLAVQGPRAAEAVGRLAGSLPPLRRFEVAEVSVAGADVLAARTGYTGEDGFELFVAPEMAARLWKALLSLGEGGPVPAGLGARDTLRLEAALPLYGHELGEDISPFEVGLGWVVKLNRPELTGYKALERASRGGVSRRLIGLEIEEGIAREGCSVVASGEKIGIVTSGSYGPWVRRAIALALVDRDADTAGVRVEVRGKQRRARVVELPFYSRNRRST
ncbi:MAG: glycine cleavage system aminomethyltransferase GcvT [Candidatus Dadabacteria bacterium]|nr:MAG: glycine cleavage system aminomethyltransferase GcvT [Candidatus Dadabacteria bacterium]